MDDAFVQQLKENRQSAEDSLKGAKMIAANSSTLYAAEDVRPFPSMSRVSSAQAVYSSLLLLHKGCKSQLLGVYVSVRLIE